MQRRLVQSFIYIFEWGQGTCTLTKHTLRWTYSALPYSLFGQLLSLLSFPIIGNVFQQTVKFNRDQFSCLKSFQQTSEKYPVRKEEINTWGKIEQSRLRFVEPIQILVIRRSDETLAKIFRIFFKGRVQKLH